MTERLRRTYEELREREEHFRSLIESALDVIVVIDARGRLSFVSPSVERVLGCAPGGSWGGIPSRSFIPTIARGCARRPFPGSLPARRSGRTPCSAAGHSTGGGASWRHPAGCSDHPSIRGVVINARDVTERKKAQEEQVRLAEQLRQAQKMESIGRLAGGIAHDINNLLSPILGYAELLLADLPSADPRAGDIEQIQGAALRARDLTRQLLAFSRKQILSLSSLDLRDVVRGFQKLLRRPSGRTSRSSWTCPVGWAPCRRTPARSSRFS